MANKWYRLDNAAIIYAPSANDHRCSIFRLAVVMKEKVNSELLSRAVNDILPRFPTFSVKMRAGLFWYYFESQDIPFVVTEENNYPMQHMNVRTCEHLFRVMYYNCRISFECFHAITDGGGALIFLKTLIRRYLELLGVGVVGFEGCLDFRDKPTEAEQQDAYQLVATLNGFAKRGTDKAYKVYLPYSERGVVHLTHGEMSSAKVKEIAKAHGATVGQIFVATIVYAIYLFRQKERACHREKVTRKSVKRKIAICVPMDLRFRFGEIKSLRNFSHYINMPLSEGEHTFETVLEEMKTQHQRITDEYIMTNINCNVRDQRSKLIRCIPLVIKNMGLVIGQKIYGSKLSSIVISNCGLMKCPKAFNDYVERFESALGSSGARPVESSVITFGDKTVLTFTSVTTKTDIEQNCFAILNDLGLVVTVDGNRRDFDV